MLPEESYIWARDENPQKEGSPHGYSDYMAQVRTPKGTCAHILCELVVVLGTPTLFLLPAPDIISPVVSHIH